MSVRTHAERLLTALKSEHDEADRKYNAEKDRVLDEAKRLAESEKAVAKAEEQDKRRKANYALSRLLEEHVSHARMSERVATVAERHALVGLYGADLHAIGAAVSGPAEPWLSSLDDTSVPAWVQDGAERVYMHAPEALIEVLRAVAYELELRADSIKKQAERQRAERAKQRGLMLADMDDAEFTAMLQQQRGLES